MRTWKPRCGVTRHIPLSRLTRKVRRNPAHVIRQPFRHVAIPYGQLRMFLGHQASSDIRHLTPPEESWYYASTGTRYIGNGQTTDLELKFNEAIGVYQPFYWQNLTHLWLPDIVNNMEMQAAHGSPIYEDSWDDDRLGMEMWVLDTGPDEIAWQLHEELREDFHPTWYDLQGTFYVVPDGKLACIDFITPQLLDIDQHPSVQMSVYGLMLALRKEGVIIPETVMVTHSRGWRTIDDIWDVMLEMAFENESYYVADEARCEDEAEAAMDSLDMHGPTTPFIAEEWNNICEQAGTSPAAYWPHTQSPDMLTEEDHATLVSFFAQDDYDIMPMTCPRAGELMETLAAGPYSCNIRYTPAPWVPGYAPGSLPGAAEPRTIQPPPEVYDQFGGPAIAPPTPDPSATHAPGLRLGAPLEERRR